MIPVTTLNPQQAYPAQSGRFGAYGDYGQPPVSGVTTAQPVVSSASGWPVSSAATGPVNANHLMWSV